MTNNTKDAPLMELTFESISYLCSDSRAQRGPSSQGESQWSSLGHIPIPEPVTMGRECSALIGQSEGLG